MIYQEDSVRNKLIAAGLRPTRQRLLIGENLFNGKDRHFTAENLHRDLISSGVSISLATIYNTLGVFTEVGLLNTVNVEAGRVFYDTNIRPHYHIYEVDRLHLIDVEVSDIDIRGFPELPEGQKIQHVDVIVRTRSA